MTRFGAAEPNGVAVQHLEVLVRTAIFKPANALVGRAGHVLEALLGSKDHPDYKAHLGR
jgi:hypothetical protein